MIHKKNKAVDQVDLIAKINIDYFKHVNEISEIMNELHDDPHLWLLDLNRTNSLLDKSLHYAWELSHGGNREKHEITIDKDKDMYVNRYTEIINDKLDLFNEIGELIDSYIVNAYNIVDGINKSHNSSSV